MIMNVLVCCEDSREADLKKNELMEVVNSFNTNKKLELITNGSVLIFDDLRFEFIWGTFNNPNYFDHFNYIYSKEFNNGSFNSKAIFVDNFDVIIFAFLRRLLFCNPSGLVSLVKDDTTMDEQSINKIFDDFISADFNILFRRREEREVRYR